MADLLNVEHLSVSFFTPAGEVQAVRDVSFSLKAGEVLAIVGESGCGKSVLCKSILRLLPQTAKIKSGKIIVDGTDITAYREREMTALRGSLFSMVFQDPMTALDPTMTIGVQIAEAVLAHKPKLEKSAVRARVIELLELVGIDRAQERMALYPHNFSGGMRQRVVLAIALAGNPHILFADEPTTALDVTIQAQILDLLRDVQQKLGLDEPIFTQYVRWAQNALHGDFGISYKYKMPAAEVIASRAGNTLLLGGIGFVLIFTLSLLLGMLCARREGTIFDRAVCKLGTITSCIPEFWLSLLLILIFAIELRVLPSSGAYSIGQQNNIADRAAHLILPLAVVVLGHLWYYAYMIRNRLLDEMRADYVLLAKAKGLTRRAVMLRHCLRNTMPTYLSIMAISVPHVLGGTYIVETVFSYPGLGTLAYESARYKDYNLLMLLSLLSGALVILCSIIAQTINEQIDPRIRAEQAVREAEVQP